MKFGDIYERSDRTVIYLGHGPKDSVVVLGDGCTADDNDYCLVLANDPTTGEESFWPLNNTAYMIAPEEWKRVNE